MNRAADLVILNLVYIFSCVPIITIGAATTAMYTVCFRMDSENEQGVLITYFHAFTANWKQSTGIWIPLCLLLCSGIFDITLIYNSTGIFRNAYWLIAPVIMVDCMVIALVFPLISQFETSWKITLKNALLLSVGQLPVALPLAILEALPLALFFMNPALFLRLGFLWILIYYSLLGYVGAKILRRAFIPLYQKSV